MEKAISGISMAFCIQICREEDRGMSSTFYKQISEFSEQVVFDAADVAYTVDVVGGLLYSTI